MLLTQQPGITLGLFAVKKVSLNPYTGCSTYHLAQPRQESTELDYRRHAFENPHVCPTNLFDKLELERISQLSQSP